MIVQLFLGFVLGLRHAADADHIVAVSGLLGDPARPIRTRMQAARLGALWGLGHLLAVFAAGCVVIALRTQIPAWLEWSLEFVVALALMGIGARTIYKCFTGRYHFHVHQHGAAEHAHLHFHAREESHDAHAHNAHLPAEPEDDQAAAHWKGPLSLGLLHGLAGTAGMTLLVLSTIPSPWLGAAYLLIFGLGATLGMAALSTLVGLPLLRAGAGAAWFRNVRLLAGLANCAFGLFLAWSAFMPGNHPF